LDTPEALTTVGEKYIKYHLVHTPKDIHILITRFVVAIPIRIRFMVKCR